MDNHINIRKHIDRHIERSESHIERSESHIARPVYNEKRLHIGRHIERSESHIARPEGVGGDRMSPWDVPL